MVVVRKRKTKTRRRNVSLKTLARICILCARNWKQSFENLAQRRGEYESVMQVLDEYGAKISFGGLEFSPSDFRATKQQCLNTGARRLLELEPEARTDHDISVLLVALRNIPAFAEYPKKMQRRLCQVGRFEMFEPRRVVLREGDPPYSFYFILSGTVLVTAYDEKSATSRTLVSLHKGMSFGELAVISQTKRQATVCSKTEVELLSISGEEFKEIFMAGGRDVLGNAKQSKLMRSVEFLRHWPLDQLRGNGNLSAVYYFDRNQILVRDSNNSDWIYVVLKGSLSIIKKLRRVEPQKDLIAQKKPRMHRKDPRRTLSYREPKDKTKQRRQQLIGALDAKWKRNNYHNTTTNGVDHNNNNFCNKNKNNNNHQDSNLSSTMSAFRRKFSPEAEIFKTPYELEAKLERTLPGYHNELDRLGSLDYDRIINDHKSRLTFKGVQNGSPEVFSPNEKQPNGDFIEKTESNLSLPSLRPGANGVNKFEHQNPQVDHQSSFLPQINQTNKVVQSQPSNGHVALLTANHEEEDEEVDHELGSYHEDADDERWSPDSQGHFDKQRQERKKSTISKTLKGAYLAPSRHTNRDSTTESPVPDLVLPTSPEPTQSLTSPEPSQTDESATPDKETREETVAEKLAKMQIQYQRRVIDREGRKTIAEELDHKGRRDLKFTEADLDPTIIQLQVLERGQYFGVTQLLFPDQPSLSVVSNGAECLVLSKKLFLQHASEKCMGHLRQTESPFPSEQELSRKLQEVVNWQAARAVVYRKLEGDILRKQALRKQFLPNILGEYCFRTGPT